MQFDEQKQSGCKILAVDVDYHGSSANVAGVSFERWDDDEPKNIYTSRVEEVSDYVPGRFFERELPCILALLAEHSLSPDVIVVDGYVYLDGVEKHGLGKHLYDALDGAVIVIGVAKRAFSDIDHEFALYRGASKNPLYVTAVGMDARDARDAIAKMHGKHRNPTLLKKADQVCREAR